MGLALAVKPVLRTRFSVLTFGVAQVAMDLEPLAGILSDWPTLHGWSHTMGGAAFISVCVAATACWYIGPLVRLLHRKAEENHVGWLFDVAAPSRTAIWVGAAVGTFSHLALDGMMHHDMSPFEPLSSSNPLLGLLGHDQIYALCAVVGGVGAAALAFLRWRDRKD